MHQACFLAGSYDDVGMRCERDAFDTLFDHAPDKLMVVKKSLVTFVNKHLNKVIHSYFTNIVLPKYCHTK